MPNYNSPNPIALAEEDARLLSDVTKVATERERAIIRNNLDAMAGELGFVGCRYEVEAARAWEFSLATLATGERSTEEAPEFFRQAFRGKFLGYAEILDGEDTSPDGFETLGAIFYAVTLLPSNVAIPQEKTLSVPILGVERIEPLQ